MAAASYQTLKSVYRTLIPEVLRNSKMVDSLKSRFAPHDLIYDAAYYENDVAAAAEQSAPEIIDSIIAEFDPSRVADLGCGTGAMLAEFQRRGVSGKGFEYASAAIEICRSKGLDVVQFDIESAAPPEESFDVVLSMEVAEHLPERMADAYVKMLVSIAPLVVITAARPGQEGTDHVNLQPPEYWIEKFAAYGRVFDRPTTERFKAQWAAGDVTVWYHSNLLIFRPG